MKAWKGKTKRVDEAEREETLWMNMVGRLLSFHDKNKSFNIPENYQEIDEETGERLFVGSWLSAQRDLLEFYFQENPERYKILETLIFSYEPGLWSAEFGVTDRLGYVQDSEYFDVEGYLRNRRGRANLTSESQPKRLRKNDDKNDEDDSPKDDEIIQSRPKFLGGLGGGRPSPLVASPAVSTVNPVDQKKKKIAADDDDDDGTSRPAVIKHRLLSMSTTAPHLANLSAPKPSGKTTSAVINAAQAKLHLEQSDIHFSDLSAKKDQSIKQEHRADSKSTASSSNNQTGILRQTFSLTSMKPGDGQTRPAEPGGPKPRYVAFKYMKKQYGPFLGIGRVAQINSTLIPETGETVRIMEIAIMKPTDKVDFFNTVFVEKAERRYPLPEASALISHLKLANGKLSDLSVSLLFPFSIFYFLWRLTLFRIGRLTEEASTQIRSLLEKNAELKLAGL